MPNGPQNPGATQKRPLPPPVRSEPSPDQPASANGGRPAPELRPGASHGISADLPVKTLVKWLRDMLLIREFENRCAQSYQQAKIGGFCHLYIGQEACAVATIASVNHDDPVVTAYRDHGHALARGMDPGVCMAEMFGKITGCAKGKGGSMHMFDKPNWLFGGHGIVGAQTPLGAGLAFAAKYEREVLGKQLDEHGGGEAKKKVCLCYLGDGALNQGAFHEAMNLAGLWSLPVIYVVENNRYSMGTSIERGTTMAHDLLAKSAAYGIEGIRIPPEEGLDAMRLYDRFKPFVDQLREEQRPGFVDLHTYRYQGHSMSDPQKYRTKEEVENIRKGDSIDRLAQYLMHERGVMSEEEYIGVQRGVKEACAAAVKFAEESPTPDEARELYSDVYVNIEKNLSPIREYTRGGPNPLV